ncbi:MAG TPA: cysteine--tRNA ligase [Ktedonobacterales bacterium]|nr:cysteine--tRNA ligase [Ktedonobacterales bacterium]
MARQTHERRAGQRPERDDKRDDKQPEQQPERQPQEQPPAAGTLSLYNTLSRQVEEIVPLEPGHIRMYSCGPTVYRFIHIGNLRTFTMADWIRRTLLAHGLRVTHIKNITDVGHMRQEVLDQGEDKMLSQARKEGKSPWEIAAFYTQAFHDDERELNILPADVYPRATDHIAEMIAMTEQLLERGYAYEAGGNVFFAVGAFPGYGRLSGNLLENLGQGQHSANENDPFKRAPEDFPLWKVAEPGRLMAWDSPWGRGFPGWHIECSAMSKKYLGPQFDLHTGGVDNIFPHHEDERAQSEAASGEQFVRYWVHGQHLLADGLKMAKSTGNAYTLADVKARGFEALALRYFFTTALYRSRINFTFRALRAAQTALDRLRMLAYRLHVAAEGATTHDPDVVASDAAQAHAHPMYMAFLNAVDADLNMPRAMAVVWQLARDEAITPAMRLALLYACDDILGFNLRQDVADRVTRRADSRQTLEPAPDGAQRAITFDLPAGILTPGQTVMKGLAQRERSRAAYQYGIADALRTQLTAAGYVARDTQEGPLVLRRQEEDTLISSSDDIPWRLNEPDRYAFSVNLIAHNNYDDLRRCIHSVARNAGGRSVELVIVENGSTDESLAYLRRIHREGSAEGLPAQVIFADHDMGFAAGRNASFRASLGRIVVLLDTSIEVSGDIWTPIERLLAEPTIGLVGPYGLVTTDLKEFAESQGPEVDAIEGYLMAFRRATLAEVGPTDEKFRFYRLMDIDYSLEFKKAGYRVAPSDEIASRIVKHPHREWYSLTEEEQTAKSKRNFDIFRRRRHHTQSLLVANYVAGQAAPWGHDHAVGAADAVDPRFDHEAQPNEEPHSHEHKHWPDHSHTHLHTHTPAPRWFGDERTVDYTTARDDMTDGSAAAGAAYQAPTRHDR